MTLRVEPSVSSLKAEKARLQQCDGEHSETFAKGAIAVIDWLIDGTKHPSEYLLNFHDRPDVQAGQAHR